MNLFVHSNHCLSRKHCETCRDKGQAGQEWRKSLSLHFQMPGDCPYGVPWGYRIEDPFRGYGKYYWGILHRWASDNRDDINDWLNWFFRLLPCGNCRESFIEWMKHNQPPQDHDSLFEWTVKAHNYVNAKLSKRIISLDEAKQIWQPSPKASMLP